MYNYIKETEQILIDGIKKNSSIFFNHSVPRLFKKSNEELHRGLNQLKLSQLDFSEYSISSIDIINNGLSFISDEPVLICEKDLNKKSFRYYFYYKYHKPEKHILTFKARKKDFYDLSDINDILEYYFCCCFNSEPYVPRFNEIQKNNFLNFIENHPYDFSMMTNNIFKKLVRGSKHGYQ